MDSDVCVSRRSNAVTKGNGCKHAFFFLIITVLAASVSPAQTFTTVHEFDYTHGAFPQPTSLVEDVNGNFYGTTYSGGRYQLGTIFKLTPSGTLDMLNSFTGTNGVHPFAGLVLGSDGTLYGTSAGFGFNTPDHYPHEFSGGNLFNVTEKGKLTVLYTFCYLTSCIDGSVPHGGLVQGRSDGDLYGTTSLGGAFDGGTIFKITPQGVLTPLYSFCAQPSCTDGRRPYAGLIQASDGNFYGTTYDGGSSGSGTVFVMTPAGVLTTLYSFCAQPGCVDGAHPYAGLVQGSDGNFYGTTYGGGVGGRGTVFQITSAGVFTTLLTFEGGLQGSRPYAGLARGSDNNFYGTTTTDGANQQGTIFEITPLGAFTALYQFCSELNCTDGSNARGGLIQGSDGNFYGTTENGGIDEGCPLCGHNGEGTIFSLSVGLAAASGTSR
jgi:uncharacterized repeat protein (TIGR03803 family)